MRVLGLAAVPAMVLACGGDTPTNPNGENEDPTLLMAPAVPLFTSPFAASDTFRLTNFFDHEFPNQFTDNNGYQLTWFNETFTNIDGHNGYDWVMPVGTPLLAVADGVVLVSDVDAPFFCPTLGRDVNDQRFVEIRHVTPGGDVITSVYVHLESAWVATGESVVQGQEIGLSGNTGCSTEPHLHFHVWRITGTNSGTPTRIDPFGWFALDKQDPWAMHADGAASINLWREPPPLCTSATTCYPDEYADLEDGG